MAQHDVGPDQKPQTPSIVLSEGEAEIIQTSHTRRYQSEYFPFHCRSRSSSRTLHEWFDSTTLSKPRGTLISRLIKADKDRLANEDAQRKTHLYQPTICENQDSDSGFEDEAITHSEDDSDSSLEIFDEETEPFIPHRMKTAEHRMTKRVHQHNPQTDFTRARASEHHQRKKNSSFDQLFHHTIVMVMLVVLLFPVACESASVSPDGKGNIHNGHLYSVQVSTGCYTRFNSDTVVCEVKQVIDCQADISWLDSYYKTYVYFISSYEEYNCTLSELHQQVPSVSSKLHIMQLDYPRMISEVKQSAIQESCPITYAMPGTIESSQFSIGGGESDFYIPMITKCFVPTQSCVPVIERIGSMFTVSTNVGLFFLIVSVDGVTLSTADRVSDLELNIHKLEPGPHSISVTCNGNTVQETVIVTDYEYATMICSSAYWSWFCRTMHMSPWLITGLILLCIFFFFYMISPCFVSAPITIVVFFFYVTVWTFLKWIRPCPQCGSPYFMLTYHQCSKLECANCGLRLSTINEWKEHVEGHLYLMQAGLVKNIKMFLISTFADSVNLMTYRRPSGSAGTDTTIECCKLCRTSYTVSDDPKKFPYTVVQVHQALNALCIQSVLRAPYRTCVKNNTYMIWLLEKYVLGSFCERLTTWVYRTCLFTYGITANCVNWIFCFGRKTSLSMFIIGFALFWILMLVRGASPDDHDTISFCDDTVVEGFLDRIRCSLGELSVETVFALRVTAIVSTMILTIFLIINLFIITHPESEGNVIRMWILQRLISKEMWELRDLDDINRDSRTPEVWHRNLDVVGKDNVPIHDTPHDKEQLKKHMSYLDFQVGDLLRQNSRIRCIAKAIKTLSLFAVMIILISSCMTIVSSSMIVNQDPVLYFQPIVQSTGQDFTPFPNLAHVPIHQVCDSEAGNFTSTDINQIRLYSSEFATDRVQKRHQIFWNSLSDPTCRTSLHHGPLNLRQISLRCSSGDYTLSDTAFDSYGYGCSAQMSSDQSNFESKLESCSSYIERDPVPGIACPLPLRPSFYMRSMVSVPKLDCFESLSFSANSISCDPNHLCHDPSVFVRVHSGIDDLSNCQPVQSSDLNLPDFTTPSTSSADGISSQSATLAASLIISSISPRLKYAVLMGTIFQLLSATVYAQTAHPGWPDFFYPAEMSTCSSNEDILMPGPNSGTSYGAHFALFDIQTGVSTRSTAPGSRPVPYGFPRHYFTSSVSYEDDKVKKSNILLDATNSLSGPNHPELRNERFARIYTCHDFHMRSFLHSTTKYAVSLADRTAFPVKSPPPNSYIMAKDGIISLDQSGNCHSRVPICRIKNYKILPNCNSCDYSGVPIPDCDITDLIPDLDYTTAILGMVNDWVQFKESDKCSLRLYDTYDLQYPANCDFSYVKTDLFKRRWYRDFVDEGGYVYDIDLLYLRTPYYNEIYKPISYETQVYDCSGVVHRPAVVRKISDFSAYIRDIRRSKIYETSSVSTLRQTDTSTIYNYADILPSGFIKAELHRNPLINVYTHDQYFSEYVRPRHPIDPIFDHSTSYDQFSDALKIDRSELTFVTEKIYLTSDSMNNTDIDDLLRDNLTQSINHAHLICNQNYCNLIISAKGFVSTHTTHNFQAIPYNNINNETCYATVETVKYWLLEKYGDLLPGSQMSFTVPSALCFSGQSHCCHMAQQPPVVLKSGAETAVLINSVLYSGYPDPITSSPTDIRFSNRTMYSLYVNREPPSTSPPCPVCTVQPCRTFPSNQKPVPTNSPERTQGLSATTKPQPTFPDASSTAISLMVGYFVNPFLTLPILLLLNLHGSDAFSDINPEQFITDGFKLEDVDVSRLPKSTQHIASVSKLSDLRNGTYSALITTDMKLVPGSCSTYSVTLPSGRETTIRTFIRDSGIRLKTGFLYSTGEPTFTQQDRVWCGSKGDSGDDGNGGIDCMSIIPSSAPKHGSKGTYTMWQQAHIEFFKGEAACKWGPCREYNWKNRCSYVWCHCPTNQKPVIKVVSAVSYVEICIGFDSAMYCKVVDQDASVHTELFSFTTSESFVDSEIYMNKNLVYSDNKILDVHACEIGSECGSIGSALQSFEDRCVCNAVPTTSTYCSTDDGVKTKTLMSFDQSKAQMVNARVINAKDVQIKSKQTMTGLSTSKEEVKYPSQFLIAGLNLGLGVSTINVSIHDISTSFSQPTIKSFTINSCKGRFDSVFAITCSSSVVSDIAGLVSLTCTGVQSRDGWLSLQPGLNKLIIRGSSSDAKPTVRCRAGVKYSNTISGNFRGPAEPSVEKHVIEGIEQKAHESGGLTAGIFGSISKWFTEGPLGILKAIGTCIGMVIAAIIIITITVIIAWITWPLLKMMWRNAFKKDSDLDYQTKKSYEQLKQCIKDHSKQIKSMQDLTIHIESSGYIWSLQTYRLALSVLPSDTVKMLKKQETSNMFYDKSESALTSAIQGRVESVKMRQKTVDVESPDSDLSETEKKKKKAADDVLAFLSQQKVNSAKNLPVKIQIQTSKIN